MKKLCTLFIPVICMLAMDMSCSKKKETVPAADCKLMVVTSTATGVSQNTINNLAYNMDGHVVLRQSIYGGNATNTVFTYDGLMAAGTRGNSMWIDTTRLNNDGTMASLLLIVNGYDTTVTTYTYNGKGQIQQSSSTQRYGTSVTTRVKRYNYTNNDLSSVMMGTDTTDWYYYDTGRSSAGDLFYVGQLLDYGGAGYIKNAHQVIQHKTKYLPAENYTYSYDDSGKVSEIANNSGALTIRWKCQYLCQ